MGAMYLTAQAVSGTDSWQGGRACGYRSSSELRMASAMPRSPGSKGRPIEGRYMDEACGNCASASRATLAHSTPTLRQVNAWAARRAAAQMMSSLSPVRLSDFDFDLPEHLIAIRPARPRSSSRLLVATKSDCIDARAIDLPNHLRPGDRLVLNDTRVLPARLTGMRLRESAGGETRARVETTLLEPCADGTWEALLRPLKKVREGEVIEFSNDLSAVVERTGETTVRLEFNLKGSDFDVALAEAGAMPLPPYIESRRPADELDRQDYQAIWARESGAVAAPTASLHFDNALLTELDRAGIDRSFVTLHVGAGTFLPVKTDDISDHKMHSERGVISEAAAAEIMKTRESGGRVIPVGTTAMRLLESAADADGTIRPWKGSTEIFITPGYRFRISDALMTNFHLPRSTLIMLVSAFMGVDRIREVYVHAIAQEYRFFSYGDASLLLPGE